MSAALQFMLKPGMAFESSTNFRKASLPFTSGWPGANRTASSDQYETIFSTSAPFLAWEAQVESNFLIAVSSALRSGFALLQAPTKTQSASRKNRLFLINSILDLR